MASETAIAEIMIAMGMLPRSVSIVVPPSPGLTAMITSVRSPHEARHACAVRKRGGAMRGSVPVLAGSPDYASSTRNRVSDAPSGLRSLQLHSPPVTHQSPGGFIDLDSHSRNLKRWSFPVAVR